MAGRLKKNAGQTTVGVPGGAALALQNAVPLMYSMLAEPANVAALASFAAGTIAMLTSTVDGFISSETSTAEALKNALGSIRTSESRAIASDSNSTTNLADVGGNESVFLLKMPDGSFRQLKPEEVLIMVSINNFIIHFPFWENMMEQSTTVRHNMGLAPSATELQAVHEFGTCRARISSEGGDQEQGSTRPLPPVKVKNTQQANAILSLIAALAATINILSENRQRKILDSLSERVTQEHEEFAEKNHTHAEYAREEDVDEKEDVLIDIMLKKGDFDEETYAKKDSVESAQKKLDNLIAVLKQLRLPSRYEDGIAMAPMRRLKGDGNGSTDGEFNWAARAVLDAIKPYTP